MTELGEIVLGLAGIVGGLWSARQPQQPPEPAYNSDAVINVWVAAKTWRKNMARQLTDAQLGKGLLEAERAWLNSRDDSMWAMYQSLKSEAMHRGWNV